MLALYLFTEIKSTYMKTHQLLLMSMLFITIACSPKQNSILTKPDSKESMSEVPKQITPHQGMVSEEIATDNRLTQGTLSNGIKYYIQKNVKPENRAELRLAVNAGSILVHDLGQI